MPKKTGEGIEYFTVATSNKYYEGWKGESREPSIDGKPGKLLRAADPVCGGYKLSYLMDGGARYAVGTTATSKSFGILMLLIFSCGTYLRYSNTCLITDSAYGFVEGLAILALWEISWVTSLRIAQRRGFLGVEELESKNPNSNEKRNFRNDIKKWERANSKAKKGTSWCWKTSLHIFDNLKSLIFLTVVKDGKFCWRLDNCLGAFYKVPMRF